MACLRVREREATEVAKELATSLAPTRVSEHFLKSRFCVERQVINQWQGSRDEAKDDANYIAPASINASNIKA